MQRALLLSVIDTGIQPVWLTSHLSIILAVSYQKSVHCRRPEKLRPSFISALSFHHAH